MPDTPEQKAAQRVFDEAVQAFIKTMGWTEDGKLVLTGWVFVGHQHGWDDQGAEISGHPIAYMGGSLPDHQALGLFDVGRDIVRGVGRWVRDDGDGYD